MSKLISPCISICRTDPVTGFCYGCARTEEEKKLWKDENINDELLLLLQKKYKIYHIDEDKMEEIFQLIEEKLLNDKIKKIVTELISDIIEEISLEYT